MKQNDSGKIVIHEIISLISILYTNISFWWSIFSKKGPFTLIPMSNIQNRNIVKTSIACFLTLCIPAPSVFTPALVKHTRVGSNWVNGVYYKRTKKSKTLVAAVNSHPSVIPTLF